MQMESPLTISIFLCMSLSSRTNRGEKASRFTTLPLSSAPGGVSTRMSRHGLPTRGQPTGVPQMQLEKDPKAASRGSSLTSNGGVPNDYLVCVC